MSWLMFGILLLVIGILFDKSQDRGGRSRGSDGPNYIGFCICMVIFFALLYGILERNGIIVE